MGYRATAPLVVATQQDGSHIYIYEGRMVPDTLSKDEVKRLEEGGFIESDEAAEDKSTSSRRSSSKS